VGRGNLRDSGEEFAGIDVGRLVEDEVGGAIFDELAGTHYGDVGGELRDYRETMGDQEIREVKFLLEFLKQQKDLSADGDIQSGDRFIGNDERGAKNQGTGDADALALSAGKLVRVAVQGIVGQANATEELRGASEAIVARELRLVNGQGLGNDFADAHARIQGSERVLENHLHLAALSAQGFSGEMQEIVAFEKNCAVIGLDQAEKHACECGFATTAFADDGEGFAGLDEETYVVNGDEAVSFGFVGKESATTAVGLAKRASFEQMGRRHRRTHLAEWWLCGGRKSGTA
jgi:hypothetical protein